MSLRWKNQLPQLQPNFVDPAGVNATMMQGYQPGVNSPSAYASQNMAGYNPNNVYMGRVSDRAGQPGSGNGYQFDSHEIDEYTAQKDAEAQAMQQREQAMQQIQQLEARLNEINTRIAEIDKSLPAGNGNDQAWEIAAQRASIGDMSAYDSMLQRGATGTQTANAIDNALMDAEKLTWGLNAKDDEDRMAARNQIEVALRKAERDAAQTGTKLPDSYYRLKNALEADVGGNASSLVNMLKYKKEKGTLTDADREYVEEMMKGKENSKEYETLMSFWTDSKGKTTDDKARAKAEKDAAYIDFKDVKDLGNNAAGQPKIFEVMQGWEDKRRKRFLKYYNVDPKTGKVTKK